MQYEIYKFKPSDIVYWNNSDFDIVKLEVFSCYTSDQYNHPAEPHKRYVVKYLVNAQLRIGDYAENELTDANNLIAETVKYFVKLKLNQEEMHSEIHKLISNLNKE